MSEPTDTVYTFATGLPHPDKVRGICFELGMNFDVGRVTLPDDRKIAARTLRAVRRHFFILRTSQVREMGKDARFIDMEKT